MLIFRDRGEGDLGLAVTRDANTARALPTMVRYRAAAHAELLRTLEALQAEQARAAAAEPAAPEPERRRAGTAAPPLPAWATTGGAANRTNPRLVASSPDPSPRCHRAPPSRPRRRRRVCDRTNPKFSPPRLPTCSPIRMKRWGSPGATGCGSIDAMAIRGTPGSGWRKETRTSRAATSPRRGGWSTRPVTAAAAPRSRRWKPKATDRPISQINRTDAGDIGI